jgi:hypothetical protein
MEKSVISDALARELSQFDQGTQLCDASGRAFGYYLPIVDPSLYESPEPEPSQEELRRLGQSSEWHSTAEVLDYLEGLE